jgi:hypothetical protein
MILQKESKLMTVLGLASRSVRISLTLSTDALASKWRKESSYLKRDGWGVKRWKSLAMTGWLIGSGSILKNNLI